MGLNNNPTISRYVIPDMPSADELLPYLRQIDVNRWYSNFGPMNTGLEMRLLRHLSAIDTTPDAGPIHLATLMTCYHALQVGLQILRLPQNGRVLIPAVTFPACPLAVQHAGGIPVFADIDPISWQLTPELARVMCAKMKIDAVMPVAVYGVPVDASAWDAFMIDTGIPVIIDAAAAFETQPVPAQCMVAHSFHATKPFSIGEGGAIICRRADWIDEARCISNFGTVNRMAIKDGSNAKLSEYHAAVGLAQLDRWAIIKQHRKDVFGYYQKALKPLGSDIKLQNNIERINISALMLQTEKKSGAVVMQALYDEGIAAHRMYLPPLYRHKHFGSLAVINADGKASDLSADMTAKAQLMPNSEMLSDTLFGLPFHAFMRAEDTHAIAAHLVKILG
jgi:dTDP-4-amino-4,6-dideoxygalactose transaminase